MMLIRLNVIRRGIKMEIKIRLSNDVCYSLCFGKGGKDKWFSQIYWFSITKEYLGSDRKVLYAEIIWKV